MGVHSQDQSEQKSWFNFCDYKPAYKKKKENASDLLGGVQFFSANEAFLKQLYTLSYTL